MSKYHDLKNKLTISIKEEKDYKKSSVTKMIEDYYNKGEEIPEMVLKNINFNNGVFSEYYLIGEGSHQLNIKNKETLAQNVMNNLPLKMYEKYMDTSWLKTYEAESDQLMSSLIYSEKFDIVNKFLELISKEKNTENFNREVFSPIFKLEHNIQNLLSKDNSVNAVNNYFKNFQKGLKVWKPFYEESCKNYNVTPKDIEKWHKEYIDIHFIKDKKELHKVNLYLLENDEFLHIIKSIFNQYENQGENIYLSKEYMEEAVKNGQEKIVTYYISELLKSNEINQEEIEKSIIKGFHEKIQDLRTYISSSFQEDYKNDYKKTYKLKEIYEIVIKYCNYKPNYKILSQMLLVDNKEFQESFVQTILPKNKISINNLNINQWKHIGLIIDQIKEITGTSYQESMKQRKNNIQKECLEFVNNNPFEFVYIINQLNKLYVGKPNHLSEKELDEVYAFMKTEINNKMINPNFDLDKFRLNNKLNAKLGEKSKVKQYKI